MATIGAMFCLALAFSSMYFSWFILMPRKKANQH